MDEPDMIERAARGLWEYSDAIPWARATEWGKERARRMATAAISSVADQLREQGVRAGIEAAANYCGAMSANVAMDIMRERYGDEACDHARDHLGYAEEYIRAIDATAIARGIET